MAKIKYSDPIDFFNIQAGPLKRVNAQAQGHYAAGRGLLHLATNERRGVMSLEANC
ncbi:hypothetical protein [Methylophaga sp. UBA678]|uniref:hypothetical protein n=1 Tax=Methylophaga sp. UBA678 TaxID=1946901 RepID=UPI00259C6BFD|nr:hypothetical protein [Methylophaga sp. UBA678]|tara:strand:- start:2584 stop:2751 length:168 start_codon:yes stop_codon:yes gene_type:complete